MQYFFAAMFFLSLPSWAVDNFPLSWSLLQSCRLLLPMQPLLSPSQPLNNQDKKTNLWQELYYVYKNTNETIKELREKLDQKEIECKTILEERKEAKRERERYEDTLEVYRKALNWRGERIEKLEEENKNLKKSLEIPLNS